MSSEKTSKRSSYARPIHYRRQRPRRKTVAGICLDEWVEKTIPFGYCHCGCGEKTKVASRTTTSKGHIKGQPYRYLPNHHVRTTFSVSEWGLTKPCTKCGTELPRTTDAFKINKRMADGLSSWCRECHGQKDRRAYAANPEPTRQRSKERYYNTLQEQRAYRRRYRLENPDKVRAQYRAWLEKPGNRERVNLNSKRWQEENPERFRENCRRNDIRRRHAEGRCSVHQLRQRIAYYGERCWMCGSAWEEIDHVIPVVRGGTNWPANLRPACRKCNRRKFTRMPSELGGTSARTADYTRSRVLP